MNHFKLWKITAYFEVGLVTTPAWQVPLESHLEAKCEAHDEIMRSSVSHGTLCRIILECLRLAVSKEVRLAHNDRKANHSKKQFSHRSGHYLIFFCLPFSRQINEPNLGKNTIFFPATTSSRSQTLKGFLSWHGALQGSSTFPWTLLFGITKDIVKASDVNFDFVLAKTYTSEGFLWWSLIMKWNQNRIELLIWPSFSHSGAIFLATFASDSLDVLEKNSMRGADSTPIINSRLTPQDLDDIYRLTIQLFASTFADLQFSPNCDGIAQATDFIGFLSRGMAKSVSSLAQTEIPNGVTTFLLFSFSSF